MKQNVTQSNQKISKMGKIVTAWKVSKYGLFSNPYFLVFGLHTETYSANIRIQSKCGKIRTRKTHAVCETWALHISISILTK